MSKQRQPLSLRLLFAMASTACVFLTVIIGYFGLTIYGEYQTRQLIAELPPAARRAQVDFDAGRIPNADDTRAMILAADGFTKSAETNQNIALIILSVFAASIGAGLSLFMAERLARPIQAVAGAARKITGGDLTSRVEANVSGIGESAQLVADFNQMASALEGFEREMTESSAAIAHELRTPLTVLRGYVQGSIDDVFPPTKEHLARLLVHIESLARIVDDLQTLSLANNSALSVALEPIDAGQEVNLLLDALEPALTAAGMKLERDIDVAAMRGDPGRLRQAVAALIENARHYAASGQVIHVQTRAMRHGVVIRVLDRGPGFPDAHLVRCFDRFWRAEPSRGKTTGGSGLGLSVVKAIAIAHGGDAHVANRPGGGLSVEIYIPNVLHATAKSQRSQQPAGQVST